MRSLRGSLVRRLVILILASATACTGSSSGGEGSSGPSPSGSVAGSNTPECIGCNQDLVVGVLGLPKCLNPVTDCADDEWYRYTVGALVLPRLMQLSNDMQLEPSALITEVPSLDNGGITSSPFSVTYHLQPNAVWSDGTAITCDDIDFTWKATLNTTGTYATYGYDDVGGTPGTRPC
jgi:peptide/nickel transport system substrate-binding protein